MLALDRLPDSLYLKRALKSLQKLGGFSIEVNANNQNLKHYITQILIESLQM